MVEYRLGELSELSGVSIRNIRAYRERGLLDPPRREGRSAYYDDRHLSQLGTINELLRKGYTSAHIAEFLSSMREGHDLADILGLQQAVFGEPPPPTAAVDIDADGDEAQRLVRHGLAEVVDGRLTLVDPNIAEVVVAADEPLRYVQTILRVADGVADQLDELAKSVVESLEESLRVGDGQRLATDYRTLGRRVVTDRLEDVLQRYLTAADNG
ncbi:MerR family transcriptional regulator [Mycolicibacterium sp. P1-18]|uniref:MerR family transcriptional regulator n=1 Tax=Mycolicibacterium sp. P1-18 TaxID=2024615 RepID=UPI0011F31617|nr:MerR family transcriptional regulator [Mycolicibacterium sp. P1-18]KAA0093204.1 MerR family transcriptional regulator [Mycolicibacterium sp. P1-18]